jgi:hypothetical protein
MKKILLATFSFFAISCVFAQIDLEITTYWARPATVTTEDWISGRVYIYNSGDIEAPYFDLGIFLSKNQYHIPGLDKRIDMMSLSSIPKRSDQVAILTFKAPESTEPGNYYLLYIVDYYSKVKETNESNNIVAIPISVKESITNINLINSEIISVYPSPSTDYFLISGLKTSAKVSIINSLGGNILNLKVEPNSKVDVSHLAKGLYTLVINEEDNIIIKTLLVAR